MSVRRRDAMHFDRGQALADERGMTLIEIMVASISLVILGSLSYGIVHTAIITQTEAQSITDRHGAARLAVQRIKRELTMAFVSLHQAEDQRTQTVFEGERDSLTFNTKAHEPLSRNSRQSDQLEVGYTVRSIQKRNGSTVDALVRRVKYHIDDRPGEGGREEILAEGVRKLEFEYYDEFREDWTDEWEVRIEDAVEMRQRLKEVQAVRDQLEDLRDDESSGVAGVAVAAAGEEEVDDAEFELLDGMFLPSRVRVRITLDDEDRNYEVVVEVQVEIPMTEPLWY